MSVAGSANRSMATDIFFKESQIPRPVILYTHGFNGFKDWGNFDMIAQAYVEAGYVFVKYNLSHNGTTVEFPDRFVDLEAYGNNNYSKECNDALLLCDFIQGSDFPAKQYSNPNSIILLGHSRGGAISILTAIANPSVRALLLWASTASCTTPWRHWPPEQLHLWKQRGVAHYENKRTKQHLPLYYQLYEDYQQHQQKFHIPTHFSNLQIPIHLTHGIDDQAVPLTDALYLHSLNSHATIHTLHTDHVFGRIHSPTVRSIPQATQLAIAADLQFLSLHSIV